MWILLKNILDFIIKNIEVEKVTKKICNRAGSIHYVNTASVTIPNSPITVDTSARNYEGSPRRSEQQREKVSIEYSAPTQRRLERGYNAPSLEDHVPLPYRQEEMQHSHRYGEQWSRDRPYGILTPVVRGIQEMLREFGARYADDEVYTLMKWGVTAGIVVTISGTIWGIQYIAKEVENIPSIETMLQDH